jgi:hypothetical protein
MFVLRVHYGVPSTSWVVISVVVIHDIHFGRLIYLVLFVLLGELICYDFGLFHCIYNCL